MSTRTDYENNDFNFIKTNTKRKKSINFLSLNKMEIPINKKSFYSD